MNEQVIEQLKKIGDALTKMSGSVKGDLPGHPFRGNQWGGGQEGGDWSPSVALGFQDSRLERVREDDDETMSAASDVLARSGLGALQAVDKEPFIVHRDSDGRVDGVVIANTDGEMSFDFGVDPDSQGQGVGKSLVEATVGYFLRNRRKLAKKQEIDLDEYDLVALPVNATSEHILLRSGFKRDGEEFVIRGADLERFEKGDGR